MKKIFQISLLIILFLLNYNTFGKTMKDLPYHHLPDGTFRNPERSPLRDPNFKWNMSKWNEEKKKIKINIPTDHVIDKKFFINSGLLISGIEIRLDCSLASTIIFLILSIFIFLTTVLSDKIGINFCTPNSVPF